MDFRTYQKIRSYCQQDLAAYLYADGQAEVLDLWGKLKGPTGPIQREEQHAHHLFGCLDLTPRENAAAFLLGVISNHRAISWQREPLTPDGRPPADPLTPAESAALWKQTREAVQEYAAFLPEREAAAVLAMLGDSALATPAPVVREQAGTDDPAPPNKIVHSTKTRRDTLTPVIEVARRQCSDPQDTAAVWAVLQVLAEKKTAPLIGATEDGLQYLKNGNAAIFNREALRKRLGR